LDQTISFESADVAVAGGTADGYKQRQRTDTDADSDADLAQVKLAERDSLRFSIDTETS